jgi:peptide/nickel transport system permease protein
MVGGATALEIALLAAGIATIFGVFFGAISGYAGGAVDAVMMRIVDTVLSVPTLFLLIVIAAILHTSFWLIVFIVALAAWLVPARLIRGETLTLRTREYVQAVRAMGGGGSRIVARHIIPNAVGTIIVNATFQIADAIGLLAALGFLGFGVPAPGTSWGQMLSDGISYAQEGAWWLIYPAGICIILVTVSFNYIGDALRDAFEVRLQRR